MESYPRSKRRNIQFDLLRIIFAILVLLSHAPELTDGNRSRELFHRVMHQSSFGEFGVNGFFLLSGFLIVQSWQGNPQLSNFLKKRILRIVPGYLVAAFISTVVVGILAPSEPHFFRNLGGSYVKSIMLLGSPVTPAAFPGLPYPFVNGALWSIAYEFQCYLLVALFGTLRLLHRSIWLVTTALLFLAPFNSRIQAHLVWHSHLSFTAVYFLGGCFYLFRNNIPYHPIFAIMSAAGFFIFVPRAHVSEIAMAVFGGYLLFYLGRIPLPKLQELRFPDISYGIYLYGWPVEGLWIWYLRCSPWLTFLASTVICCGIGWLSWHFIERPMLALKRKSSAPLPIG